MNKIFKTYNICWAILFTIFNVICFITPNEAVGLNKFGGAFRSGYIFITLAFIGQLICAYFAFKADSLQKFFYNIPLIQISLTGLVLTLILGSLCMAIPNIPNWIGVVICLVILAFMAISVINASTAGDIVSKTDEKIEDKTSFIKALTADAESLIYAAKTPELKKEAKKVHEAIKYSDPVSNAALTEINEQIRNQFSVFADAVKSEDSALVSSSMDELLFYINNRNEKCKLMK